MRKLSDLILAGALIAAASSSALAQSVLYAGGTYSQNFDSLATSGTANAWSNGSTITGWYSVFGPASTANTTRDTSTTATTVYTADSGTSTTGGIHSFGVAGVNALTERALGSFSSATQEVAYGVLIQNTTGLDITSFTVTYDGEQWRNNGNTAAQSLVFDYTVLNALPTVADIDAANVANYTAVPALNFTSPITGATASALDGNAAANRIAGITSTQSSLRIFDQQYIYLRWWDNNDAGNDHGLALDNFSFSATTPTPGAITLLGLGGLIAGRRKR
jgi:MYXO-CTERM domain-containing protein